MTPGRDAQIVAHVDGLLVRALDKQLDPARAQPLAYGAFEARGDIAQDLSPLDRPTRGGGQIQLAVAPEYAFTSRHQSSAGRVATHAQVARRTFNILHVDPDHVAPVTDGPETGRVVGAVRAACVAEGHGLKPAALDQLAGRRRDEAVEQAVRLVFGQIDDAGARVDADRFMLEPAHGLQRNGIDQTRGGRGHLEDIAVGLGHISVSAGLFGFLAGQPTAPRGVAAAAVGAGAGQGQELAHDLTRVEIIDQCGRATGQGATVLVGVIALRRVEQADPLLMEAARSEVAVQATGTFQFVVPHEGDAWTVQRKTTHSVELARDEQTIVHGVAALGDDLVGKAFRQVEQAIGVCAEGAVAVDLVDVGLLRRRRLCRDVAGQTGEGEGGGRAGDEITTMGAHGDSEGASLLMAGAGVGVIIVL